LLKALFKKVKKIDVHFKSTNDHQDKEYFMFDEKLGKITFFIYFGSNDKSILNPPAILIIESMYSIVVDVLELEIKE
jgi:hypothetical protein